MNPAQNLSNGRLNRGGVMFERKVVSAGSEGFFDFLGHQLDADQKVGR
jgi:hypothetical protein